jgi:hypothetical protein
MKKFLAVFFLMISVVLPQSSFAAKEIIDPQPVLVPANMKSVDVVKNIKRALVGRGWTVEQELEGKIDAVLYLRTHVARVSLNYSDKEIGLTYVSSENLDYKEKKGKRYIHKNYISWVNNVMMDINKNLQLAAIE